MTTTNELSDEMLESITAGLWPLSEPTFMAMARELLAHRRHWQTAGLVPLSLSEHHKLLQDAYSQMLKRYDEMFWKAVERFEALEAKHAAKQTSAEALRPVLSERGPEITLSLRPLSSADPDLRAFVGRVAKGPAWGDSTLGWLDQILLEAHAALSAPAQLDVEPGRPRTPPPQPSDE